MRRRSGGIRMRPRRVGTAQDKNAIPRLAASSATSGTLGVFGRTNHPLSRSPGHLHLTAPARSVSRGPDNLPLSPSRSTTPLPGQERSQEPEGDLRRATPNSCRRCSSITAGRATFLAVSLAAATASVINDANNFDEVGFGGFDHNCARARPR
jgi:hypothetical protein